jgi:xanthine dehydrogenase accessory factor
MEHAVRVMTSGKPSLVMYDSSSPDDIVWGMNLGCGGVIRVFLEPLPKEGLLDYLDTLAGWMKNRHRGGMATLYGINGQLRTPVGARCLLSRDGWTSTDISERSLLDEVHGALKTLLYQGRSHTITCRTAEGTADLFLEVIEPPVSLVIFGAGPDAVPLAGFAEHLGWEVTVIDARPALLRRERFPGVDDMILTDPDKVMNHISFTGEEAVVIMTHNFDHDCELLKTLFASPVRYIGLLASRGKAGELLKKLSDEGYSPTEEQLSRLYTPVGLDIGAETPEQIALAVAAEVQAVVAGHTGGFLRSQNVMTRRTTREAKHRAH